MKHFTLFLIAILSLAVTAVAGECELPENNLTPVFRHEGKAVSNRAEGEPEVLCLDVTVTRPGELVSKLGDDAVVPDSLVVRGPIGQADLRAMFIASLKGLSVMNLQYAVIENNRIPDSAFWDEDEQLIPGTYNYYCMALRHIIFPEGLQEIGETAFMFAKQLETINIPSTLRKIGEGCFAYCSRLNSSPLVFPEGMTEIGRQAFDGCNDVYDKEKNHWKELKVVIPSTIKTIPNAAFNGCHVSDLVLPQGVGKIGSMAFYGHNLRELVIPESCKDLGESAFSLGYDLEKVTLPEGITSIPQEFVSGCMNLKEVRIPSSLVTIGASAFEGCRELTYLDLPEGLKQIDVAAFRNCHKLTQMTLPSSLESLGEGSCTSLRKIYCKATTPPDCPENPYKTGYGPFGPCSNQIIEYPLYVPVGSATKYRTAWGWRNFANVIETNDFPAGIEDVLADGVSEDQRIYDMSGRIVLNPLPGHLYIKGGKKFISHD